MKVSRMIGAGTHQSDVEAAGGTKVRRVVFSHAITCALGALYLAWLALPLGAGQWRIDSTIHWWWLLVPAVLVGVGAGVCQGLLIGFGRFWPTLVPLTLASPLALWSSAVLVAPSLFGSDPEQPTPDLLIAAALCVRVG